MFLKQILEQSFYIFFQAVSVTVLTKAFLSAVYDFEKNGVRIKTKLFNEIIIYLNILGGTYLLDYFEENELKEKITEKIDNLLLIMD